MECFDNLIGLKGVCTTDTPDYYLNRVGITKQDLVNIITRDYADVPEFLTEKSENAIGLVTATINSHFSRDYLDNQRPRHYQTASIVDGVRLGFSQPNKDEKTASADAGIHLSVKNTESYMQLNITELELFLNHSGAVTVEIWDLYQDKQLATESITAVAGEKVKIYPNIAIDSNQHDMELFIGYDTSGGTITSYNTTIRNGACCGDYYCRQKFVTSQGVSITGDHLEENITGLTHTAGLSVVYSITCRHEGWICNHTRALALPILYKTASEVMLHGMHNSPNERAHTNQTLDQELLEERYNFYESKYHETLEAILHGLQLPQDPRCFSCNPTKRHVIALP